MLEFLIEIIINILFAFPGAGVRWLFHRGEIPFKVLLKEDFIYNAGAFLIIASLVILIFVFINQYLELRG